MSSQPPTSGIQQTQDGTRIIPQSRRPDGSIRKERRIRDGFVPQEDVERYTNARMDAAKTPTGYVPGLGVVTREVKGGEALSKNAKKNAKKRANKEGGGDGEKLERKVVVGVNEVNEKPVDGTAGDAVQSLPDTPAELEKKIKGLRKKLRQIEDLELKDASSLLQEQKDKISKKHEVIDGIKELEDALKRMAV